MAAPSNSRIFSRYQSGIGQGFFTEADFAAQPKLKKAVVNKALAPKLPKSVTPDPAWTAQAAQDAKQDFKSIPYDGVTPNKMVCDTTLRELPDGSWILFMLAAILFADASLDRRVGLVVLREAALVECPAARLRVAIDRASLEYRRR